MTAFAIPLKRYFFNVAVSSLSADLPFKPYFLFFNPRISSVSPSLEPLYPLDCIVGIDKERFVVFSSSNFPELTEEFSEFCQSFFVLHNSGAL
jgi:hypothetical protein